MKYLKLFEGFSLNENSNFSEVSGELYNKLQNIYEEDLNTVPETVHKVVEDFELLINEKLGFKQIGGKTTLDTSYGKSEATLELEWKNQPWDGPLRIYFDAKFGTKLTATIQNEKEAVMYHSDKVREFMDKLEELPHGEGFPKPDDLEFYLCDFEENSSGIDYKTVYISCRNINENGIDLLVEFIENMISK